VAVLIGRKQYERLVTRSRRFSEAWDEFVRDIEPAKLEIDPDKVFADSRSLNLDDRTVASILAARIRRKLSNRKHSDATALIADDRRR
jgi:hypothetical protein